MAEGENTIPAPSGHSIQNWQKSTRLPAYIDQYNLSSSTCTINVTIVPTSIAHDSLKFGCLNVYTCIPLPSSQSHVTHTIEDMT